MRRTAVVNRCAFVRRLLADSLPRTFTEWERFQNPECRNAGPRGAKRRLHRCRRWIISPVILRSRRTIPAGRGTGTRQQVPVDVFCYRYPSAVVLRVADYLGFCLRCMFRFDCELLQALAELDVTHFSRSRNANKSEERVSVVIIQPSLSVFTKS